MKHTYSSWPRRVAVVATLLSFASVAHAQTLLGQYSFTGATGSEATFNADAQPTNAQLSPVTRGTGVVASAGSNTFAATDWSTAALDATDYFSFSVTPSAGYTLRLDSLRLDERRSGTGIRDWAIRSSLDNFTANLLAVNVPDNTDTRNNTLVTLPAAFAAVASPVEFRIYGYNAEAAAGSWRIDDLRVLGTAVASSTTVPTITFGATAATVAENAGTVQLPVTLSAASTQAITVEVAVATAGGTATSPADYTFATQTLTFPAGSTAAQNATLTIVDDAAFESAETVVLSLRNVLPAGAATAAGSYTLTITDNDVAPTPVISPIATLTVNDATGVPMQNGAAVAVRGTVYGTNTRTTGYQLTVIDNTGGIGIFSSTAIGTIVLAEGDSVEVAGTLGQFNGLTQITLTSITPAGRARRTYQPRVITTALTEAEESELVRIPGPLTATNPGQWLTNSPATTTGYNVTVADANGVTYQIRINNGTTLYNQPAPAGPFSLTGVGSQFDNSSPYTEGYQIIPRGLSDLALGRREAAFAATVAVFPNPATTQLTVQVGAAGRGATLEVFNSLGQRVQQASVLTNESQLDISALKSGVYSVRLTTKAGSVSRLFVKQ
ncbi:T9SS type A sorting domain-containing protein [Hymenobacter mucosus]|uniref:Por secretion system C-terminal sorting domain-containing protein n=1 Tax=Hymenobacter mucosus TaxID=1411120 RepID=A0A238YKA9_9BACT|nr:Calx-beta domain-containing protein [Hymenobacter mucosus]SNR71480.1 Por secretion system C-terminal sorting domain-containing protein [Hymenobacter mucosus]